MSALGKRYARAAIGAALDIEGEAGVEQLAEAVASFRDVFVQSEELRSLLANPALKAHRDAVLGTVLSKIGASKIATRLIIMLTERDRINVLPDIADAIVAEADVRAGRVRAHVASAMPLDESKVQRLKNALNDRFKRDVVVNITVDPELLGGLVCRVGDLTLDSSLKRQLELLREQVLQTHA
ncbi:MAG: ATP synthase F1 subunit delta [Clostridia bacterium]|nr:ATP synthase F1 subunit delta [Deltaproteobacteria bacterium]